MTMLARASSTATKTACHARQVVLACFLATLTMYTERVGFSIAYTAMVGTGFGWARNTSLAW